MINGEPAGGASQVLFLPKAAFLWAVPQSSGKTRYLLFLSFLLHPTGSVWGSSEGADLLDSSVFSYMFSFVRRARA
jgi:hypothetical protein